MKAHLIAAAALLTLAACSQPPAPENSASPTPEASTTASQSPTATAPAPATDTSHTAEPGGGEEQSSTLERAAPAGSYTAPDQSSQSSTWPDTSAQALPYAVNYGYNYVDVVYSWDGTGELSWYTPGWADEAFEEGSGLPIDVHSNNVLQIHVGGLRLPEPDEYDSSAFTLSQTLTEGMTRIAVSGAFEGQHTVTIGARTRMPYAVEVMNQPNAQGGTDAVLRVYFEE
ncbi:MULTISPECIES: AMIN-like domain-containing (lipo)protein [Trueperella]|uniref:AMIN-like domain-containing protein n=1 Tax=Trueperella abortisuis TaxID=445930 RepID=A0ABT9PJS5_9ACTO|nr:MULTISPECIES: hypothetical protein [Trueperella]MDP9832712.1 hypothetical protein [Trueperella abortisuis]MDY5403869.1 hypothetical protein [Trueperella sp.]